MGGHLVTIESEAEERFLVETFGHSTFWVGAHDFEKEGEFVWISGRPVKPLAYEQRFNNFEGFEHTVMWWHTRRYWNDSPEIWHYSCVCEWER